MKQKLKTAAVLTVYDAAKMSAKGRRDIIRWLERQAETIRDEHQILAKRWTARYLYK